MAVPFQPAVSLSASADGSIVTVSDVSNYSTNSEGVLLSNILNRNDVIIDGLGNPIQTFNFSAGSLTYTFPVTKDYYLHNTLLFTLADTSTRSGIDNVLLANFYLNAAREVSRTLRTCGGNSKLCNSAVKANLAYNEAVTATSFDVPSEAQYAIDDANALINEEVCLC